MKSLLILPYPKLKKSMALPYVSFYGEKFFISFSPPVDGYLFYCCLLSRTSRGKIFIAGTRTMKAFNLGGRYLDLGLARRLGAHECMIERRYLLKKLLWGTGSRI